MSFSYKTDNLGLPIWGSNDKPTQDDLNYQNRIIDENTGKIKISIQSKPVYPDVYENYFSNGTYVVIIPKNIFGGKAKILAPVGTRGLQVTNFYENEDSYTLEGVLLDNIKYDDGLPMLGFMNFLVEGDIDEEER